MADVNAKCQCSAARRNGTSEDQTPTQCVFFMIAAGTSLLALFLLEAM